MKDLKQLFHKMQLEFAEKYDKIGKLSEAVVNERLEVEEQLKEQKAKTRRVGGALGIIKRDFDDLSKRYSILLKKYKDLKEKLGGDLDASKEIRNTRRGKTSKKPKRQVKAKLARV